MSSNTIHDNLFSTLKQLERMDCLGLLKTHLECTRQALDLVCTANLGSQTIAIIDIRTRLDDYYYFLERLKDDACGYVAKFQRMEEQYASEPRVVSELKQVNNDLDKACQGFIEQTRNLNGGRLLTWVHIPRHFVESAGKRLADLELWAKALIFLPKGNKFFQQLSSPLKATWPELLAQAWGLFELLKRELNTRWSYQKGQKAQYLVARCSELFERINLLDIEAKQIKGETYKLLEELANMAPAEAIVDLKNEWQSATLNYGYSGQLLYRKMRDRVHAKRFDSYLRAINVRSWHSMKDSHRAINHENAINFISAAWLQGLKQSTEGIGSLNRTARSVRTALDPLYQLTKPLDYEQNKRVQKLKSELAQHLIERSLSIDNTGKQIMGRLSRFALRLLTNSSKSQICTDSGCGGAFLQDDQVFQCPICSEYRHQDCLINGLCAYCAVINQGQHGESEKAGAEVLRQWPVFLLIDCSEGMRGAPNEAMKQGINLITRELQQNRPAKTAGLISIVAAGEDILVLTPPIKISNFNIMPALPAPKGTLELDRVVNFLSDLACGYKETQSTIQYYRPTVFFLSSGERVTTSNNRRLQLPCNVITIGCGTSSNLANLKHISDEVLLMQDVTPSVIQQYFRLTDLRQVD